MGRLDPLALRQLAAWEAIAIDHPVRLAKRETGQHLTCRHCDGTVIPMDDTREGYTLSLGVMQAALVAHLRHRHGYLDPDKGE